MILPKCSKTGIKKLEKFIEEDELKKIWGSTREVFRIAHVVFDLQQKEKERKKNCEKLNLKS